MPNKFDVHNNFFDPLREKRGELNRDFQKLNSMKTIAFSNFDPIRLEEMDQVKLMNRTDTKYWFHVNRLPQILNEIQNQYFVLNINNETILPYSSVYYDTFENRMFAAHHNGKLNRYKIRRRSYMSSEISFLEVKFKSNKGRTIKKRIPCDFGSNTFSPEDQDFLSKTTPFPASGLQVSLVNTFDRITLVNKNFNERCTIDYNLEYTTEGKHIALDNLVIVEIKSEGHSANSLLSRTLRDKRIKASGFSKYCVGRTLTDSTLKRNAFKSKIRMIEKTIHTNNHLLNPLFS